ncbi:MAG: ABC transporter ATP-binding protein [Candidatus Dormibacteria bacterium]
MSTLVDSWRGRATREQDDQVASTPELRARSRRLFLDLLRPHHRRLALASALIMLQTASILVVPYLVGLGIDLAIRPGSGSRPGNVPLLLVFAAAILVAAATGAVSERAFIEISGRVGQDVLLELRTRVFAHFQRLSVAFHEDYTSGRVISRLTSDIDAISELLLAGFTEVVVSLLKVVGIGTILVVLDRRLGLLTLSVFVPIFVLAVWFKRESEVAYRAVREAVALVIVHYVESLRGIRAVQAFRREPRNQQIFEEVDARYRAANTRSFLASMVFGHSLDLIGRCLTAVLVGYGAYLVLGHSLTFGVLTAFVLYVGQFFEPMQDVVQFYNLFQSSASALEKLALVLDEAPSVPEPAQPLKLAEAQGELRLEEVSFGYDRDRMVLVGLDLRIPARQTVALVGATGAGKSTFARLLARFYDPQAGRVLLDGIDLRDLPERDLRRNIVAVTQEAFLFSGTVADNIRFGRHGASDADVEAAARAAGAHPFITALPAGYDTEVMKRGGRLSAGQRQLLAFARAFLADPRVLILDEATSSLDLPTERQVQRALRTLLKDRTAIIIAHRLSTVEIADRVLVIGEGKVIEDGAPAELMRSAGHYRALHSAWIASLAG